MYLYIKIAITLLSSRLVAGFVGVLIRHIRGINTTVQAYFLSLPATIWRLLRLISGSARTAERRVSGAAAGRSAAWVGRSAGFGLLRVRRAGGGMGGCFPPFRSPSWRGRGHRRGGGGLAVALRVSGRPSSWSCVWPRAARSQSQKKAAAPREPPLTIFLANRDLYKCETCNHLTVIIYNHARRPCAQSRREVKRDYCRTW